MSNPSPADHPMLALLDAHTEAWRKVAAQRVGACFGEPVADLTAAEHHAQDTYNALAAAIVAAQASGVGRCLTSVTRAGRPHERVHATR